jgi:formamidopyrimidine-DNA glycosylase
MPELPEVETMRRGIAHLAGLRIQGVTFPRRTVRPISLQPGARAMQRRLTGRTVAAMHRYGKRVAIELDSQDRAGREWLVIEPRMTGLMLVADPPTQTHVRMEICLEIGFHGLPDPAARHRLTFWDRRGLGTIRLLDERGLAAACGPDRLGPDGLSITGDELRDRLGTSRRAVKVALLDQHAVAGIGNIYAAEILREAGIDPRVPCRRLTVDHWEQIAAATRGILAEAVRLEGSTITDETYKTADNRSGQFQLRHRVYGREGKPCHECDGAIRRIVQAQRSTFFCPSCQWHPRR